MKIDGKDKAMQIELKEIPIRDLVNGYVDKYEEGIVGYGGKLDIRPPYQREFIYDQEQRDAVIETVLQGFPLNSMYWAVKDDGNFEILDGQQRTISICTYVNSQFSVRKKMFHNLQPDESKRFLDYKLMVYHCSGEPSEKLAWFRTINIAGEALSDQELHNAVYSGPWVTDARRYFSKRKCPAKDIGGDYVSGEAERGALLEKAIGWISNGQNESYMQIHQHKPSADELWLYFQNVINWTKIKFPNYRHEMKGVPWGELYNKYKDKDLNPKTLEREVARLMEDEDVTNKKGIYLYVLNQNERHLNIREFSPSQKREAYERQKGICFDCKKHFQIQDMEGHHIKPWSVGGKTLPENCRLLCSDCNRQRSNK